MAPSSTKFESVDKPSGAIFAQTALVSRESCQVARIAPPSAGSGLMLLKCVTSWRSSSLNSVASGVNSDQAEPVAWRYFQLRRRVRGTEASGLRVLRQGDGKRYGRDGGEQQAARGAPVVHLALIQVDLLDRTMQTQGAGGLQSGPTILGRIESNLGRKCVARASAAALFCLLCFALDRGVLGSATEALGARPACTQCGDMQETKTARRRNPSDAPAF